MAISDTFETSAKVRITGALMANYTQKAATIVGELVKVEADGKKATLKTTDDQYIQMPRPLSPQQLTEVQGIVLTRNQLQCHRIIQFKPEMSEKFDRSTYNEFVTEFVKNCDQHVNCMAEDEAEDNSVIVPIDNFSLPDDMATESTNTEMAYTSNSYF